MIEATVLRPEGRAHNAPGQRYWTMAQGRALVGRRVEIRDYYATFRATVTGLVENPTSGFLSGLVLVYDDGRAVPCFSLNVTREIALVGEDDPS